MKTQTHSNPTRFSTSVCGLFALAPQGSAARRYAGKQWGSLLRGLAAATMALVLHADLARGADPCGVFMAATSYGAGSNPRAVAVGDFNGDGYADLAVANRDSANVSVLLNNQNGTFQTAIPYPAGTSPNSVAVGYFDDDDIADLAVANASEVRVMLGNGNGTFQFGGNYAAGVGPTNVAVGDFDRDGFDDLVVVNSGSTTVSVLLNDKNGAFPSVAPYFVGNTPIAVAVGKFDSDDYADLAVATDLWLSVLKNDGDGTFTSAGSYSTGQHPSSVAVGDFNGDGKPDLAVPYTVASVPWVSVILNKGDGTGTFFNPDFYKPGSNPSSVAAGDFDGDGNDDLAVANAGSANLSLLLRNDLGGFDGAVNYAAGNDPRSVAVGDFNGDLRPDLAVVNALGVMVFLGNPDGTFEAAVNYNMGNSPTSVAVGNFNILNDSDADLAVASASGISVSLGNGDGTFQAAVNYTAGGNPTSVAVGDFNRDGKSDLVAVRMGVSVLLGNGDDTFQLPLNSSIGTMCYSVAVGDLDGDGDADLTVATYMTDVSVLLGNGDGTFGPRTTYAAGTAPNSVAIGDFNGDNRADLVVAVTGGVSVLLGNGNGTFQLRVFYSAGLNPSSVAIGSFNVNSDTHADLVVAGAQGVAVFLGNGNGTFQTRVPYTAGGSPSSVAIGDFDGDTYADLAVANKVSANVSVLLGNGNGAFQAALNYAAGEAPISVAVGHFNGDSKPDLVVANNVAAGTVSVLLGKTCGPAPTPPVVTCPTSVTASSGAEVTLVFDVSDADGDALTVTYGISPGGVVGYFNVPAGDPPPTSASLPLVRTFSLEPCELVKTYLITVAVSDGTDTDTCETTVTVTGPTVSAVQSAMCPPGGNASATTVSPGAERGVSVTASNPEGETVVVTVADYSEPPPLECASTFSLLGRYYDVQITGAGAGDSATANFYYPPGVTGPAEADLRLSYWNGSDWAFVLSSGGTAPVQNPTDNLDGTASGGRFTVVFSGTSTPMIAELRGTVFVIAGKDTTPPVLAGCPTAPLVLDCAERANPGTIGAWLEAVTATDSGGRVCVYINEWLATSSIGSDWFELYNAGSSPVDLNGYYLTDTFADKTRYTIPSDCTIPPGGFLLVWADGQSRYDLPTSQLHVNFLLSTGGEAIGLYAPDLTPVDEITFDPQTVDVSEGRNPDGSATIMRPLSTTTPGARNGELQPTVNCGDTLPVVNDYAPGRFSDECGNTGEQWVTFTATDACGNSASCSAKIIIQDTTPPSITCPVDVTVECTGSTEPSATGSATATDNCDPNPTVTYSDNVAPGVCQAARVIARTWTATDQCNNFETGVQRITVVDTLPPVFTACPLNIVADADPGQCSAVVTYTPVATDNCMPNPTIDCTPPSGIRFPVGTSDVVCTARDACGNTSVPCRFTVTMRGEEPPVTEWPVSTRLFPPPGAAYASVPDCAVVRFDLGGLEVWLRKVRLDTFPSPLDPPALEVTTNYVGSNTRYSLEISTDRKTYYPASATGDVEVQMRHTSDSLNEPTVTELYDLEMLRLNAQGNAAFGPIWLRESPTQASVGTHTIRHTEGEGGYHVSSFFDVFLELSINGGISWSPADRAVRVQATVPCETNPPVVTNVVCLGSNRVQVAFNEMMDVDSTENPANYSINGASVPGLTATLLPPGSVVELAINGLLPGVPYTLTVTNVNDLCGNILAPNPTTWEFSCGPCLELVCPGDLRVPCQSPTGAAVQFTVWATNHCPPPQPVTVTCVPPSGSFFPAGVTRVRCEAHAANVPGSASCSFLVTVTDLVEPRLSIERQNTSVLLSWPATCTRYQLEATPDLNPPIAWTAVLEIPILNGARYEVTLPIAGHRRFFRLREE